MVKLTTIQSTDHPEYQSAYLKLCSGETLTEELHSSMELWEDFIFPQEDSDGNRTYAEGKWTFKEVLQHVVDTERVFQYRALAFLRGETQELPGFNHDGFVQASNCANRSISDISDEMVAVRNASIQLVKQVNEDNGSLKGKCSGYTISVAALFALMGGHLRHHLGVLKDKY